MARLKEHAQQLNLMLARKAVVKQLALYSKEKVKINAGMKFYGKISSTGKETPLRLTIIVVKGVGSVNLYVSEFVEHPSQTHSDLEITLQKKNNVIVFAGSNDDSTFKSKCIYLAFEAEREAVLFLSCYFGKLAGNRTVNFVQRTEHRNSIMSINDIYTYINQLKSSENDLQRFNQEVKEIVKKRKDRALRLSGQVDILKRNMELDCFTGCLKGNIEGDKVAQSQRILQAIAMRKQSESFAAMKKFLLVNRYEINKILVPTLIIP
eukprot:TRINITY_DN12238_c0_g7_i1.p1 TRINITY_DN12238_c0_g7~~TRINITY_DN12238_c0_g7_i1.p1  ORF type:complete len:265 (+),score=75.40 TRINITY_DN12238_c0_g7_i1:540-1334(+)